MVIEDEAELRAAWAAAAYKNGVAVGRRSGVTQIGLAAPAGRTGSNKLRLTVLASLSSRTSDLGD